MAIKNDLCRSCYGSGKWRGEYCSSCNGTGIAATMQHYGLLALVVSAVIVVGFICWLLT